MFLIQQTNLLLDQTLLRDDILDIRKIFLLLTINESKSQQSNGRNNRTNYNKGCSLTTFCFALIRKRTKQRKHKQRKNIIQRHNQAGPTLAHTEFVGKNHGDGSIIGLPECHNQEKGKTN